MSGDQPIDAMPNSYSMQDITRNTLSLREKWRFGLRILTFARQHPTALLALFMFSVCSTASGWDTNPLAYQGTIWSEFVPDREGRILRGSSNDVLFAGISHYTTGGSYESPVFALVQYGQFVEQVMPTNYPFTLDQYLYQRGLPVVVDLAADTNGNQAVTYTIHEDGQVAIRCATQLGTNVWAVDQIVSPFSFTPYEDSVWMDSAMVEGHASVAHLTSVDGRLYWTVHVSETNWTTELVATNAQGPIAVAVSPQGILTVSFVSDDQYRWAYRLGGSWFSETVGSGRVSCAALAFDRNGAISTVYRPESSSNLLYAVRGTFGGWNSVEIGTPAGSTTSYVDLEFDNDNTPALAYSDAYNTYFAQRVGIAQWSECLGAASSCGGLGSPPCSYSWQYMGREPDLLFLADGTPIILHHGYSGNRTVSSRNYIYYTSWARMRETPWDWVYHDDADGMDDRTTVWVAGSGTYALNQTEVLDSDEVAIRVLTSKNFQNIGGQMWVHWWNGTKEHWVRGFPEQDVVLEPGALNGLPLTGAVTIVQWKCDIGAELTGPGLNYYAIQIKVGSTLPLGEEVFDEDWLLREVTGTEQALTNNIGQAVSEEAEFSGHDWSVTVYADLDGDKIPDLWEETYGLSSTNSSDALLDSDGDGIPNIDEYVANTIPTNEQSYFAVDEFSAGEPLVVTFFGFSSRLYTLESGEGNPEAGGSIASLWQTSPTYVRVRGSNDMQSATDTPSGTSEFFRIRVSLP